MKTVRAKPMGGSGKTLISQLAAKEKKPATGAWQLEKTAHGTHEQFEAGTFKTLTAVVGIHLDRV